MAKITTDELERYLRRRCATGGYFIFVKAYLKVMSRDAALLVQLLINLAANAGDAEGWALCTLEFLKGEMGLERDAQHRVINELKALGFLEVERRGMPAYRYVRPNIVAIERAIDALEPPVSEVLRNPEDPGAVVRESTDSESGGSRTTSKTSKNLQVKTTNTPASAPAGASPAVRVGEATPSRQPSKGAVQTQEVPPPSKATEQDRKRACRLHDMLVKHRKLFSTPSIPKWADEFRRLREQLGAGQDRVDPLLDWYEQHLPDRYTPQAYSARTFRDKFAQLEAAAERCRCKASPCKPEAPPPELDKAGQRVLAELLELHWPKGSAAQVPHVVAASLAAYRDFLRRLKEAELPRKLSDFRGYLLDTLSDPATFVSGYLERECARYARWEDWSGTVQPLSPTARRFVQLGYEFSQEWCGGPERWDELMRAVGVQA